MESGLLGLTSQLGGSTLAVNGEPVFRGATERGSGVDAWSAGTPHAAGKPEVILNSKRDLLFSPLWGDEAWPWVTVDWERWVTCLSIPFDQSQVSSLPGILPLHVLRSKCRLGHLVSILHQFVELAVHQDARVRVQPCKGQDRAMLSTPPSPPRTHLGQGGVPQ